MSIPHGLQQLVGKFRTRGPISEDGERAILALPTAPRHYESPAYLIREGSNDLRTCAFIVSGFAIRHKLTADGARQIVAVQIPGDFIDLQHLFLDRADHSVQALTRLETIEIERGALRKLALEHAEIGHAMWVDALVEASVAREWVLNVGRRDARARVAHLLCEFTARMQQAGLTSMGGGYELPMTQEQIGDAVGLTSVHVNRTLRSLVEEGVVTRDRRHLSFQDWGRLKAVGDFSALYLHLDQASAI